LAKPNYQYEKRQKDLAKKKKKEEKLQRKAGLKDEASAPEDGDQLPAEAESAPESAPE